MVCLGRWMYLSVLLVSIHDSNYHLPVYVVLPPDILSLWTFVRPKREWFNFVMVFVSWSEETCILCKMCARKILLLWNAFLVYPK